MGEQDREAGAVQVLDPGEIDDDEPAVSGRGPVECLTKAAGIAHVDLADRGQDLRAVQAQVGGEGERSGHGTILSCMSTVVPASPGLMVTCCMRARISGMPCPRFVPADWEIFQRPVSVTVSRSWVTVAAACSRTCWPGA